MGRARFPRQAWGVRCEARVGEESMDLGTLPWVSEQQFCPLWGHGYSTIPTTTTTIGVRTGAVSPGGPGGRTSPTDVPTSDVEQKRLRVSSQKVLSPHMLQGADDRQPVQP